MNPIDSLLGWARKQACLQLHIPHTEIWVELEFTDKDGRVYSHRRQRSKSWNRNAYKLACIAMMDTRRSTSCVTSATGIKKTDGGCAGNEYNIWSLLP